MASKADALRKYANEYLQRAKSATNSLDKNRWLQLAEHCFKMAVTEDAAAKRGVASIKGRLIQAIPYQFAVDLMAVASILG